MSKQMFTKLGSLCAIALLSSAAIAAPDIHAAPLAPQTKSETFVVFFGSDSAALTPLASRILARAADAASHAKPVRIIVTRYADNATQEVNTVHLSAARAEAVKSELSRDGLDRRLIAVADGDGLSARTNPVISADYRVVIEAHRADAQQQASR